MQRTSEARLTRFPENYNIRVKRLVEDSRCEWVVGTGLRIIGSGEVRIATGYDPNFESAYRQAEKVLTEYLGGVLPTATSSLHFAEWQDIERDEQLNVEENSSTRREKSTAVRWQVRRTLPSCTLFGGNPADTWEDAIEQARKTLDALRKVMIT